MTAIFIFSFNERRKARKPRFSIFGLTKIFMLGIFIVIMPRRRIISTVPRRRRRVTTRRRIAIGRIPMNYQRVPLGGPVSVGGARRRRRRTARGGNIFRKIWSGVKSGAKAVHNYAKDNKLVSRGLRLLPTPWSGSVASAADALGYGARGGATRGMYRMSPGPHVMVT